MLTMATRMGFPAGWPPPALEIVQKRSATEIGN
jgi:hypothetical protein